MSKPTMFVTAVLVLIALAFTPGVDAVERKDVLVIGMATSDIISLDPAKAFEFSGVGIINQVYDKLLDFPAGRFDKPELSLAESWKVSDARTATERGAQANTFPPAGWKEHRAVHSIRRNGVFCL